MTGIATAKPAPKISVIMPVFNAGSFLEEAIESALNQRFTDFEFLIHDDGSTDGSLRVLRDYAARDSRIVLSAGANEGVFAARNLLQAKAQGDLLAVMDADDICLPDRFEKQVAYLDANPECVVLGGSHIIMDAVGRPILRNRMPQGHDRIDGQNIHAIVSIHHPTVMMRRGAVLDCGGYDASYRAAGDLDLWLRMAERGRLANLPDIVLKYRLHDKSISGAKGDLQRRMCRQACEAAWARRGLTGMSFDYSDWRMDDTLESRRKFHLRYGWQAWNSGYRDTWRHYAMQSVKLAPFSKDAWRLLIAGAIKRPEKTAAQRDA